MTSASLHEFYMPKRICGVALRGSHSHALTSVSNLALFQVNPLKSKVVSYAWHMAAILSSSQTYLLLKLTACNPRPLSAPYLKFYESYNSKLPSHLTSTNLFSRSWEAKTVTKATSVECFDIFCFRCACQKSSLGLWKKQTLVNACQGKEHGEQDTNRTLYVGEQLQCVHVQ